MERVDPGTGIHVKMAFHWQSKVNVKQAGVDDMVLLPKLSEAAIVDNLKKRLQANSIFTYIGQVLISVNPFKTMPYFTEKEMEIYQGASQYENPPHVYALADNMYRNMLIDAENQCVIISGESGAGKTVAAKYIMNYISRISGGGQNVQHVKDVILQSNPLLEAFGNSATVRNWNSSRFGKYVEILFSRGGEPIGGKLSNFLLEKSRVVYQNKGDRNFHIFYQLIAGADKNLRSSLGIGELQYYNYLNMSGVFTADDTDDGKEFQNTLHAMKVVGLSEEQQLEILRLVSAVLHIGNITFEERDNFAAVQSDDYLEFPAFLLGVTGDAIKAKLTGRKMESRWGNQKEDIEMKLNVEQADYTRDAWVKAIYSRLFDFLVRSVNEAMQIQGRSEFSVGILDIYGFEIFDNNGFEQFCINFVNEKLQQIFIELTLKKEQEEYVKEGIKWTEIEYFNNKIVCDLIESKRPPGIMCLLDDTCAQNHGQKEGVDRQLLTTLSKTFAAHQHFLPGSDCFVIKHYAGDVTYNVEGFSDRNRDVLYPDLILMMQASSNSFVRGLFPDVVETTGTKRPTTFSTKIKNQANLLVDSLMKCSPHYVRCIKPNETKRAGDWDDRRVQHQVEYLGLKENIRVRRAGYAYRREFDKFAQRYAILTPETWPRYQGSAEQACRHICESVHMDPSQFQMGRSKIFIKNPESLFLLEESRERRFDGFARTIQKNWRRYQARKQHAKKKEEAADLMFGKKERRRFSLNRNFVGDYIGLEHQPALVSIVGKRQRIEFAATVNKYDRKFKTTKLDLILTTGHLNLIGREKVKKGADKGKIVEVIKRKIDFSKIQSIGLSPYQDDFVILYVRDEFTSLLETPFKTEFCTALSKRYKAATNGGTLNLDFRPTHTITLKKTRFGGGTRTVQFHQDPSSNGSACSLKSTGNTLNVTVSRGLPNTTRPSMERPPDGGYKPRREQLRTSMRRTNKTQQQQQNLQPVPQSIIDRQYQPQVQPMIPQSAGSSFDSTVSFNNRTNVEQTQSPSPHKYGGVPTAFTGLPAANGAARRGPKPPPPAKPKLYPTVTALYAYEALDTDELSFNVGEEIELMSKDASGWWQGKIGNRIGLFPGNYVKE